VYTEVWELTVTPDWPVIFREVGVGLGVLLVGIGILYASVKLGNLLQRVGSTLDEVDRQVAALGAPVVRTLDHVNGIAGTADETLARVGGVVGRLEAVADTAAKGANLVGAAFQPALVNLGSTVTGITAGLRRLVRPETKP
jgi:ABC-type transporter Mla subunit MlaD